MNPFKILVTPEYFFRPRQAWLRLQRGLRGPPPDSAQVTLPWGDHIRVHPRETIGAHLWYYGIFDLAVAETLTRLIDPGDTTVDVGANIGQMTSLMRWRAGPKGEVFAFEPHPDLFCSLEELVQAGGAAAAAAPVRLFRTALSDCAGSAWLDPGSRWETNQGLSRVVQNSDGAGGKFPVALRRLDEQLPADAQVGLMKVDVEGHELAVFRGAEGLLARRAVRDIVYEDLGEQTAELTALLRAHGFEIFALQANFWRTRLCAPAERKSNRQTGENYLATLAPERALARHQPGGWQVLRGGQPCAPHASHA